MSEHINNQTKRKETLKRVIRQLHEGKTVEEVKGEFAALLQGVGATESWSKRACRWRRSNTCAMSTWRSFVNR